MYIDKSIWHICQICNKNIKDLAKIYGGSGIYYTKVFLEHLRLDHNINKLEDYFGIYDNRPICKCNICGQKSNISTRGSKFYWSKYVCGRNDGIMKWSIDAKENRKGPGNPMYHKKSWNRGLNKYDNLSLQIVSEKLTNREIRESTKIKQSESAKKRVIHGHTGHKHSKESKEKMRQATILRIHNGEFKQTKTKPHKEMCSILIKLNIEFREEKIVNSWAFDFYLPKYNIYIEVDGDYFHSNPKLYPNGPITKTQKINAYRDNKKNEFCIINNLKLIRFWESDILNNKEYIICNLEKLLA